MDQGMQDDLDALADGKKLFAYQGRHFPVAIFRVENSHEWEGRRIITTPKNSLLVMPPERGPGDQVLSCVGVRRMGKHDLQSLVATEFGRQFGRRIVPIP